MDDPARVEDSVRQPWEVFSSLAASPNAFLPSKKVVPEKVPGTYSAASLLLQLGAA